MRALASQSTSVTFTRASSQVDPVAAVKAVLDLPDSELDYAQAKLAFDRIVDPSVNSDAVLAELQRMADAARTMAGAAPNSAAKFAALRKFVYESGPWNGERPFAYDQSDPMGRRLSNALLHNYLATRLGQCVSMPILFLILAERIGLNVALATAPDHVLVCYTEPDGRVLNLETTSGAHPARLEWYRGNFPMSDRSLETGLYMRPLTRREGVALMASTVRWHLHECGRFEEAIAACQIMLSHSPRDALTMVAQGSAYGMLLEQFRQEHPSPFALSTEHRMRLLTLVERNRTLFAAAEALGWEEPR